jgi:hypothetical protein
MAKFLLFEYLISIKKDVTKLSLHASILGATVFGTLLGHPSFIYRTLISSNTNTHLRQDAIRN